MVTPHGGSPDAPHDMAHCGCGHRRAALRVGTGSGAGEHRSPGALSRSGLRQAQALKASDAGLDQSRIDECNIQVRRCNRDTKAYGEGLRAHVAKANDDIKRIQDTAKSELHSIQDAANSAMQQVQEKIRGAVAACNAP